MSNVSGNVAETIQIFRRLQTIAAGAGIVGWGGLLAALFLFNDGRSFYSSFMFAWVVFAGMALGGTVLTYLHHTIRATWSLSILRVLEASNKTMWYVALLWGVVIVVGGIVIKDPQGNNWLYQWANDNLVRESTLLQKKEYWLNVPGFIIRGVFFFAFWLISLAWFNRLSREEDLNGNPVKSGVGGWKGLTLGEKRQHVAPGFGVLHVVFLTLAWTDWIMSLDAGWYSTIYAGIFMVGQILANLSLGMIVVLGLRNRRPYNEIIHKQISRDLGTVLLGFTMFWAYFTLSQFLIIWSGNLPEEIPFFINRFTGGMNIVGGLIVLCQFFIPFIALLSVRLKRDPGTLLYAAIWVFVLRSIDCWWQIVPFFRIGPQAYDPAALALDLAAWAGVGGVWFFLWAGNMINFAKTTNAAGDSLLIARHDTRLQEAKEAEAAHA
jgi:hypothetical protein